MKKFGFRVKISIVLPWCQKAVPQPKFYENCFTYGLTAMTFIPLGYNSIEKPRLFAQIELLVQTFLPRVYI